MADQGPSIEEYEEQIPLYMAIMATEVKDGRGRVRMNCKSCVYGQKLISDPHTQHFCKITVKHVCKDEAIYAPCCRRVPNCEVPICVYHRVRLVGSQLSLYDPNKTYLIRTHYTRSSEEMEIIKLTLKIHYNSK
jgi:hypothetical protein